MRWFQVAIRNSRSCDLFRPNGTKAYAECPCARQNAGSEGDHGALLASQCCRDSSNEVRLMVEFGEWPVIIVADMISFYDSFWQKRIASLESNRPSSDYSCANRLQRKNGSRSFTSPRQSKGSRRLLIHESTPTAATADDISRKLLSTIDHCGNPVRREQSCIQDHPAIPEHRMSGSRTLANAKPGQAEKVLMRPSCSTVARVCATFRVMTRRIQCQWDLCGRIDIFPSTEFFAFSAGSHICSNAF
jgi:hypothetical protein